MTNKITERIAQRFYKNAGWWAIKPGSPGIHPPPVDKGGLMNAIPGVDPGDAALYNGDGPADIMDETLRKLGREYHRAWGRDVKPEELKAVWDFCTHRIFEGDLSKIEKRASMVIHVASAHMKKALPVSRGQEKFNQIMRQLELDPQDPTALYELQKNKRMLTPGFVLTIKDWQSLTSIIGARQAQELWGGYAGTLTKYIEWPGPMYQNDLESELKEYAEKEIENRWENYSQARGGRSWGHLHPGDPRVPDIDEDMDLRIGLWGIAGEDAGVEILEEGETFSPPKDSFHIERPVTLTGTNAADIAGWLIEEYETAFEQQAGVLPSESENLVDATAYNLERLTQRLAGNNRLDWGDIRPVSKNQIQILTNSTKINHVETTWSMTIHRHDGQGLMSQEIDYLKRLLGVR